jgi:hypothetical protein
MWLRVCNERWSVFRVNPESHPQLSEKFAGGYRNLNEIAPDGGSTDAFWNIHKWIPIPLRKSGNY